jgi:hypothetical protein
MKNPYVLIATHNRVEITKKNIGCIHACGAKVILVVTDESEAETFRQHGDVVEIVMHGNLPLGSKWQAGVLKAKEVKADPLIINGSDDILHPLFFERVKESIAEGFHFFALRSWYLYDLCNMYRLDYLPNLPLGGGRAYTRELLEVINYSLFDKSRDRQLDDLGWGNALNSNLPMKIIKDEPLILSIKGNWNTMNPTYKLLGSHNVKVRDKIKKPNHVLNEFKICVE